ncbi:hypothetical protein JTB14_012104 [Gonioctena quinquepunctata]|nr:hypothetical protein JTB14_012104 [Gonioctena quinquepunctata]
MIHFSKQIVQKHQVKAQKNEVRLKGGTGNRFRIILNKNTQRKLNCFTLLLHNLSEERGKLLTDGDISQTVADNDIKQKYIVTIQDIIQAPIIITVPSEASADANIVLETSGIEIDNFSLCNLDSSLLDVTVMNLSVDMLLDSNSLHDYTDTDNNFLEIRQDIMEQKDNENEVNTSNHPIGTQRLDGARVQNNENSKPNKTVLRNETEENQVTVAERTDHYQASVEKSPIKRISGEENIPTPFKKALFWPSSENQQTTRNNRKQREKLPAVASSSNWQEYHRRKSEKKKRNRLVFLAQSYAAHILSKISTPPFMSL